jgi:hypothetical protein
MTSLARFLSSVTVGWLWTTREIGSTVQVFGVALAIAFAIAAFALSRMDDEALAAVKGGTDRHDDH